MVRLLGASLKPWTRPASSGLSLAALKRWLTSLVGFMSWPVDLYPSLLTWSGLVSLQFVPGLVPDEQRLGASILSTQVERVGASLCEPADLPSPSGCAANLVHKLSKKRWSACCDSFVSSKSFNQPGCAILLRMVGVQVIFCAALLRPRGPERHFSVRHAYPQHHTWYSAQC